MFCIIVNELYPEHALQETNRYEEGRVNMSYALLDEGMAREWVKAIR